MEERTDLILFSLPLVRFGQWKRELTCSSSRYHLYAAVYGRENWPDHPLVTICTLRSMEERTDLIFLSLPLVRFGQWKRKLTWFSSRYHLYAAVYGRENWSDHPLVNIGTLRSMEERTDLIFFSLPLTRCGQWKRELTWSSSRYHLYAAFYGRENWSDLPLVTIGTLRSMEERTGLIVPIPERVLDTTCILWRVSVPLVCCDTFCDFLANWKCSGSRSWGKWWPTFDGWPVNHILQGEKRQHFLDEKRTTV